MRAGRTLRILRGHARTILENQKIKRLARFSAFTYKAKENKIIVVEDFSFDAPKTKAFVEILKKFNLQDAKTLMLVNEGNRNVYLSGRNLPRTKVMRAIDANTYDVLNATDLIICENSIADINKMLGE